MAFFTSRRDIAFDFPVIMSFNGQFLYVFVPGEKYQLIIGPARFSEEVYLRWKTEVQNVDEAWLETVPVCGFKELGLMCCWRLTFAGRICWMRAGC